MRVKGLGVAAGAAVLALALPVAAEAQEQAADYVRCSLRVEKGGHNYDYYVTPVVPYEEQPLSQLGQTLREWLLAKGVPVADFQYSICERKATREELRDEYDGRLDAEGSSFSRTNGYGGTATFRLMRLPEGWSKPGWDGKSMPGQRLTLAFADPGHGEGYRNASIDLVYKFLICDDEVQVAYAIDRKSVRHSAEYQLADKNGVRVLKPDTDPPAPVTIPLVAQVRRGGYGTNLFVRDKIAGEALGMGCFTGQTQKIGTTAQIFTGKPTRQELPGLLGLLSLSVENPIPFALKQPSVRDRAEEEAKAQREAEEREWAEAEKRALTERNAKAAAEAKAQTEAIQARQAEYQRQMESYRAGVAAAAAAKAKYDADKAANDAAVAEYETRRAAYEAQVKANGR